MENLNDIYTISLNPSIDYSFMLGEDIVYDDINRIKESRTDPGGKGLNVARMLSGLGCRCTALALLGGENGDRLKSLLERENIRYRHVEIKGNSRSVYNFFSGEKVLRFNQAGPRISNLEKRMFFGLLEEIPFGIGDMLSISGSLPRGLSVSTYRKIIEKSRGKGVYTVLDADGEALSEGIMAAPDVIKPNMWEFERIAGEPVSSYQAFLKTAEGIINRGISTILLTLGSRGALLFSRETLLYSSISKVRVESTVGCGDAFLAGFLHGVCRGFKMEECLKWASASGTAKACVKGTLMPEKKEIARVLEKVKVRRAGKAELDFLFGKGRDRD